MALLDRQMNGFAKGAPQLQKTWVHNTRVQIKYNVCSQRPLYKDNSLSLQLLRVLLNGRV